MPSLVAAYTGQSENTEDIWLNLWQPAVSSAVQAAGTYDLWQMWAYVQAGLSAKWYKAPSCPIEISSDGVVSVALDFYVFPSDLGLSYSLASDAGKISDATMETVSREFDVVFDFTDTYELDFLCESVEWEFETAAYDVNGNEIATPTLSVSDNVLTLSASCWCVVRVKCSALGYKHSLSMELTKFEQVEDEDGALNWTGYSIANLASTIQATWMDEDELQSDELDLEIPSCIEDYLSACDDGSLQSVIGGLSPLHFFVWYSTCSGDELAVRSARDEDDDE